MMKDELQKKNMYHHYLVPVSWISGTNTLKAANQQRICDKIQ